MPTDGGRLIVITAPLTEIIDHAGYFIQMSMASLPMWLEGILNKKYPNWRQLEYNDDGSARYMPAGAQRARNVTASPLRQRRRRVLLSRTMSTRSSDRGRASWPSRRTTRLASRSLPACTRRSSARRNSRSTRSTRVRCSNASSRIRWRSSFRVIVGGSGGWQISQTDSYDELGVDCVVEGRSESEETFALFDKAINGESLPRKVDVSHPVTRDAILFPDKRTTFGVVEMTTGCGRRCQFCVPDLNPQIDLPRDKILAHVRANVRDGNKQISLATEDMFIWGQVHTSTPFYFPNREALLDLYRDVVNTPGVEQHVLSHATIAPAVVDPVLIERLSESLLDKSPIHLPYLSSHPKHKALVPLIGLETGSVATGKRIMPSKAVPFPIDEWPSVVIRGLEILNRNNWFPAMTLIVGSPDESDDDVRATIDLIYEVERRGLFAFFIPSIFTPLHDTRMEKKKGVTETRQLTPLQWQLMMKCWKMNLRPGQNSWWAPTVWRLGALALWAFRLRKMNGPGFTWPLFMFASALPEQHDGATRQDPRRPSVEDQESKGAARDDQAVDAPLPAS